MMNHWRRMRWVNRAMAILGFLGLVMDSAWAQVAAGTAFTYQGRLVDGALAANGPYDLQFALFDGATGGTQIGSPVEKGSVAVAKGLFTVELDFGGAAFNGDARWLEIGVRPGGSADAYTVLSPRQKLNPTPYAMRAANGGGGGSGGSGVTAGVPEIVRSYSVAAGETVQAGDVVTVFNGEVTRGVASDPADATATFHSPLPDYFDVATLSPSKLVIAYKNFTIEGLVRIGSITDGPAVFGPSIPFHTGAVGRISVVGLGADRVAILFVDSSDNKAKGVIGSASGDMMTFGSEYIFSGVNTLYLAADAISSDKLAIAIVRSDYSIAAMIAEVSGSLLAFGSPLIVPSVSTGETASIAAIAPSTVVVNYVEPAFSDDKRDWLQAFAVSGNVLTLGPSLPYYPSGAYSNPSENFPLVAKLDMNRFLLSYSPNFATRLNVVTFTGTGFDFGPTIDLGQLFPGLPLGRTHDMDPISSTLVALAVLVTEASFPMVAAFARIEGDTVTIDPPSARTASLFDFTERRSRIAALGPAKAALAIAAGETPYGRVSIVGTPFNGLKGFARGGGGAGQMVEVALAPPHPVRGITTSQSGLLGGNYYYALPGGTLTLNPTTTPMGRAISPTELLVVDP